MLKKNQPPAYMQHIVKFKKGDYLFRQDDTTHDLYILKTGSVRIFKTEGDVEIDLDIVGAGNVIGEVASIDGGTRTASGIALEDCEALFIPSSEFQIILSSIPEWFRKIALILVQRLREVDSRISRSVEGDRTNHVAAVISLLAFTNNCIACNGGYEIDKKLVEHQIVDLLNVPLGEISKALEKLNKLKFLKLEKTKIILLHRESLDELAEKVFHESTEIPII